jgi:hypothetical protein
MQKSSSCLQFWTSLGSVLSNTREHYTSEEVHVEALPCGEHDHWTNPCPGQINPKHELLGGDCAPDASRPPNISADPHRRPRILQINPCFIPRVSTTRTSVGAASEEGEKLSGDFDPGGFLGGVQSMGHTLEIDSSHLKIIAQNPLHRFVVYKVFDIDPDFPSVVICFTNKICTNSRHPRHLPR